MEEKHYASENQDLSRPRIRAYLLVLAPVSVNIMGSVMIWRRLSSVLQSGKCSIGSTWISDHSSTIVGLLYPAALKEARLLAALGANCVADLHLELAAALSCVMCASLIALVIVSPFNVFLKPKPNTITRWNYYRALISCFLLSVILFGIAVAQLYYSGFINIHDARSRFSANVVDGYIEVGKYIFLNSTNTFMIILGVWFFCLFAVGLIREMSGNNTKFTKGGDND